MEEIAETKEEAPGRDAEGSRLSLPLRVLGGGDPGGWAVDFGATPRGLSFGSCQGPTSPRPGHGLPSLHSSGEKREKKRGKSDKIAVRAARPPLFGRMPA